MKKLGIVVLTILGCLVALVWWGSTLPGPGEEWAIGDVRVVNTAQVTYQNTYKQGFACVLSTLGEGPGWPNRNAAGLIKSSLASGFDHGYAFVLKCSDIRDGLPTAYTVLAFPTSRRAGKRLFCSEETGVIRYAKVEAASEYAEYSDAVRDCHAWAKLK